MSICSYQMSVKVHPSKKRETKKTAIPIAHGKFSEHFGGASEFLICEANPSHPFDEESKLHPAPEHKPGSLPKWLAGMDVDAVVASSFGKPALLLLAEAGIETWLAGELKNPSDLAAACLQGKLTRATLENACCDGSHHHEESGHDCAHH